MTIGPTSSALPPSPAQQGKLDDAAAGFEAMFLAEMLKSVRSASDSADAVRDFADEQLAQVLAASGGLGIRTLILSHLAQPQSLSPPADTEVGRAAT